MLEGDGEVAAWIKGKKCNRKRIRLKYRMMYGKWHNLNDATTLFSNEEKQMIEQPTQGVCVCVCVWTDESALLLELAHKTKDKCQNSRKTAIKQP